jgi:hypothetical protein
MKTIKIVTIAITFILINGFVSYAHNSFSNIQGYGRGCTVEIGSQSKSICEGDSILLEATNGFTSYSWSTGESTRLIWVKKAGKYVVTANSSTGCTAKDSIEITVFPLKELKIFSNPNPPIICSGKPVVLEASGGFKSYWWSNGNTTDRTVVEPKESRTYVLEAVDSNGCDARAVIEIIVEASKELKIFSNPNPAVICAGQAVVLEASEGFKNYWWSNGNTTNRTVVEPKESRTYVLEAVDSNGCDARAVIEIIVKESRELNIFSNPNPAVICLGDSIVLEANAGFANYWWSTGSRNSRIVVSPKENTKYVLEAVDSNGCGGRAEIFVEVDSCNSSLMNYVVGETLNLYPNPSTGIVSIELKDTDAGETNFEIFDINNRIVYRKIIKEENIIFEQLDLTNVLKGIYILKIRTENSITTRKIIIH